MTTSTAHVAKLLEIIKMYKNQKVEKKKEINKKQNHGGTNGQSEL